MSIAICLSIDDGMGANGMLLGSNEAADQAANEAVMDGPAC
jgi:hypothetical protein